CLSDWSSDVCSSDLLGSGSSYGPFNFYAGPQAQLNGPYDDPLPKPMEHALGITPRGAPQIKSSELCATCHAIDLPVLDGKGRIRSEARRVGKERSAS